MLFLAPDGAMSEGSKRVCCRAIAYGRTEGVLRDKSMGGAIVGDRMKTYIALFRGINVGGNSVLPMKELVTILEGLGLQNVRTYIQSGNAFFQRNEEDAAWLSNQISAEIKKNHGFEPKVLLLEFDELEKVVRSNPFPEAESEPNTLHVNFLASMPTNPDLKTLERLKSESERFILKEKVLYLHAPDGIGRSKFAASAERLLGVPLTSRNWRTVGKIMAMAKEQGTLS